MIITIEGIEYNGELFNEAMKIRFEVFVDDCGVDKHLEYDGLDQLSNHYLLTVDGKPIATARWRETQDGIKLERFAVKIGYRGKAYGTLLLKFVIDEVINSKKDIYLHAQENAIKFYEKSKFKTVGESFLEANINHYKMIYIP